MIVGEPSADELTDRIYEASVVPELWPEVLRLFAAFADSRVAAIIATNGDSFKWIGCSPAAERLATEHYQYAGGKERSARLIGLHRAGFATDREVFSDEEMRSIPLYTDCLFPQGYGRGLATAIYAPSGEVVILNAEGDTRRGPVTAALLRRLDGLRPHFARSTMLAARLAFERARTAVETLSGLGYASCAVTRGGKVLLANAEFTLEARHWTTRMGDVIALTDKRADRQLAEALAQLDRNNTVRSIPVLSTPDGLPAVIHVVPVRRSARDLFVYSSAILVLTTASTDPTRSTALLQALFDLSATEAVIASRIAAGQTTEHIAATDSKSHETVRNQLKSVLAKTGCRRQADLARVLAQLIPARKQPPAGSA